MLRQREIDEATEDSVVRVAYNASLNEYAVGGSYGPGGSCVGQQGLFIRHLEPSGTGFDDVAHVEIQLLDKDGTLVPYTDKLIQFSIAGAPRTDKPM